MSRKIIKEKYFSFFYMRNGEKGGDVIKENNSLEAYAVKNTKNRLVLNKQTIMKYFISIQLKYINKRCFILLP